MTDDGDEIIGIASFALSQLIQKKSSVESGVRATLRVATMRRHTFWQFWAYLNLHTLSEPGNAERARKLLQDAFPDSEEQRLSVVDSVFQDLKHCREVRKDKILIDGVGQLESKQLIADARIKAGFDPPTTDANELRDVLFRVKNRVQMYLMAIENGKEAPKPSAFED